MNSSENGRGRRLTTKEVAEWLGISVVTLHKILRGEQGQHRLPHHRLSEKVIHIYESDLESWYAQTREA